jgi:hypothetical protein
MVSFALNQGLFLTMILASLCQAGAAYVLVADATPEGQWSEAEGRILTNVKQLTSEELGLTKSGEAYFSPDMKRIIFQISRDRALRCSRWNCRRAARPRRERSNK